ncbi:MAG TPA: WecB/TagA/CpsF family glycosyltransferase [Roseiflexaceae bacterium]|nr:WecB/TagA/CpsF family glycosyltransferase [Roseiflexaceae bacterium]HMP40962.1 WecB/TagA/CpsF family glycosyltransferase [Roseiflexaceae bacterium]
MNRPDHAPHTRRRLMILGVAIDDIVEDEVVAWIAAAIAARQPHYLVTVNPEFIVESRTNPHFAHALAGADLATADGIGVLMAARYLGTPLRARVTGADLSRRLAAEAAAHGWSIFLLGAAPGVAEQTAGALRHMHPALRIAGCFAGSPAPHDDAAARRQITAARPDLLLVAYRYPDQEIWIARNLPFLGVPVTIGVGGAFDFIAGVVPRAPAWMRRLGFEWLYRLSRQPQRWRRIIKAVPQFLWILLRNGRRRQHAGKEQ